MVSINLWVSSWINYSEECWKFNFSRHNINWYIDLSIYLNKQMQFFWRWTNINRILSTGRRQLEPQQMTCVEWKIENTANYMSIGLYRIWKKQPNVFINKAAATRVER